MMRFIVALVLGLWGVQVAWAQGLPKLKVSDNKRFLVTENNKPFFWLADTGWELFHRLTLAEAEEYLETRKKQGFNVVQAVAIAEFDGHTVPNVNQHLPLIDLDPAKPANDYWNHVDAIVAMANKKGIYIGFLPTWGRYWHDAVKDGKPLFTKANAEVYGEWLGKRYRQAGLVWILGGDRKVENAEQQEIIRAMAKGLKKGDGGQHLMTFHPAGGQGSASVFHEEAWLDFNMRQNGHVAEFTGRYDQTKVDYDRQPVKPVIDGEPIYEDHPVSFKAKELGHSNAADVRRTFYWDVFTGACGHTYGHHTIWQFWTKDRQPVNNPLMEWKEALNQPGAQQMIHGRKLIESRPFLTRIPDDSLIVTDRVPTLIPGAGRYRFVATRDTAGTYAFVYVPTGRPFRVDLKKLNAPKIRATWYDPRTGESQAIGELANTADHRFTPPQVGEQLDWILILDDVRQNYPLPK